MCGSTVVKEVPESSSWYGTISAGDAQSVRDSHQKLVEAWLDEASFAAELFKLHEKYGIERGEAGYSAYCDYLRKRYYETLRTAGPTRDPLDEGCECLFCQFNEDEALAAAEAKEKPNALPVRCADQESDRGPGINAADHDFRIGKKNQTPDDEYDASVSRYDSVGGVEPVWDTPQQTIFPIKIPVPRRKPNTRRFGNPDQIGDSVSPADGPPGRSCPGRDSDGVRGIAAADRDFRRSRKKTSAAWSIQKIDSS